MCITRSFAKPGWKGEGDNRYYDPGFVGTLIASTAAGGIVFVLTPNVISGEDGFQIRALGLLFLAGLAGGHTLLNYIGDKQEDSDRNAKEHANTSALDARDAAIQRVVEYGQNLQEQQGRELNRLHDENRNLRDRLSKHENSGNGPD